MLRAARMRFVPLLLVLASCTTPFSCDPDYYEEQPDLAKRSCFDRDPGATCQRDDQCCSKTCAFVGARVEPICCRPAGATCTQPLLGSNDCCSGICNYNSLCVACFGRNSACDSFRNCCSGACDNGKCACSTTACNVTADCCAGTCERGRCMPDDMAVPIDFSRPVDLGDVG